MPDNLETLEDYAWFIAGNRLAIQSDKHNDKNSEWREEIQKAKKEMVRLRST